MNHYREFNPSDLLTISSPAASPSVTHTACMSKHTTNKNGSRASVREKKAAYEGRGHRERETDLKNPLSFPSNKVSMSL